MTGQVTFTFEGRRITAEPGQSIAGALLAAGIRVLSRSIKYRRPRGYTCGWEACNNCALRVDGLPGVAACTALVHGGEVVRRERGWPSAGLDVLRVTDLFARFLPTGFQFRLFPAQPRLARLAEVIMARFAGAVRLPEVGAAAALRTAEVLQDDGEVLVVGGGLSGCAAALAAADAGARVTLVSRSELGGRSLARRQPVNQGKSAHEVAAELAAAVARHDRIRVLQGTALGWFEGGVVPVVTGTELIECRPTRLIAATGSYDVPALFPGNDKPGVLLADGVSRLLSLDHVAPGARAVVLTDSTRGYWLARQLSESGVRVACLVDQRADPGDDAAVAPGVEVAAASAVTRAVGLRRIRRVLAETPRGRRSFPADVLCVALGERPANELALQWRYAHAAAPDAVADGWREILPGEGDSGLTVVGSAAGWASDDIDRAARDGARAAQAARTAKDARQ